MELYWIYFGTMALFLSVQMTCVEADKHIQLSDGANEVDCAVTNSCDETKRDIPNQRETAYAYKVELFFIVSEPTVKFFGKGTILEIFEDFLNDEFGIHPKDVFSLMMAYTGVLSDVPVHSITIVLQAGTYDVRQTLSELWKWTDCVKFTCCNLFRLFETEVCVLCQHFRNSTIEWNGIKTVICFEIDLEHGLIEGTELLKAKNQVTEFLQDRFLISQRYIYDLAIANSTRETPKTILVEFSLPPIMANSIPEMLMNLKIFIDQTCADGCKQPNVGETKDDCSTCESIRLFGASVYPYPGSLNSKTDIWTGNETRFKPTIMKEERRCNNHQEPCTNRYGVSECVGVGLCDKFFYKTIEGSFGIHGSIRGLDLLGLDNANKIVASVLVGLFGFCESAFQTEFVDLRRSTTRLRIQVLPFLGRPERMKELENKFVLQNELVYGTFTINLERNSFTKTYLDHGKIMNTYINI